MKPTLSDLIDLEYLMTLDGDLDTQEKIQQAQKRDREIFSKCPENQGDDNRLILEWVLRRRLQVQEPQNRPQLPGSLFEQLRRIAAGCMSVSGALLGLILAYSILAYHGSHPVNVTQFMALFVLLPLVISLISFMVAVGRMTNFSHNWSWPFFTLVKSLLSSFLFSTLPRLLQKLRWGVLDEKLDMLESGAEFIRTQAGKYPGLFFWPLFRLGSLFAMCLSAGVLAGTLFRVLISDLAFGWQSTISAGSQAVYTIVSWVALPWSFLPSSWAYPSLAEIEGSRIILKDTISVLVTQDLVSWWPFICLALIFYTFLPRLLLLALGRFGEQKALSNIRFDSFEIRQLLSRMRSSALSVKPSETAARPAPFEPTAPRPAAALKNEAPVVKKEMPAVKKEAPPKPATTPAPAPVPEKPKIPEPPEDALPPGEPIEEKTPAASAVILASHDVYSEGALMQVNQAIEFALSCKVRLSFDISMDEETDTGLLNQSQILDSDQVVMVYEVWQPPIRGLLYYISQIRKALPDKATLIILLTREADEPDLALEKDNPDFDVWEKAVKTLSLPGLYVKRMIRP